MVGLLNDVGSESRDLMRSSEHLETSRAGGEAGCVAWDFFLLFDPTLGFFTVFSAVWQS